MVRIRREHAETFLDMLTWLGLAVLFTIFIAMAIVMAGCGGAGGGGRAVLAIPSTAPALVAFRTDAGVEVKAPAIWRNSAQLEPGFREVDASVAAFARIGIPIGGIGAPNQFQIVIDPTRHGAPAIYLGRGEVLAGWGDPPFLPGLPEALGALAEEAGAPVEVVAEAVAEARAAVALLYVEDDHPGD
jgi:hypothetical protein